MTSSKLPPAKTDAKSFISDEISLVLHAALLAAWIGLLLWSSLASNLPSIPRFLAWDKLQHLLAYAVLMTFSGLFFKSLCKKHFTGWITGFAFSVFFGILMEIAQEVLSANRHADWTDAVANTIGAFCILLVALLRGHHKSHKTND